MHLSADRSVLLCYNTVERMLKGDFFHTVTWETVAGEISSFPPECPIVGIGTTNWFRRNGETIVLGTVSAPQLLWADPEGERPMEVIDLLQERPRSGGTALVTPSMGDDGASPPLPFLALGVCQPASARVWECPATASLHAWIQDRMAQENIGLAAVRIQAQARAVTAAAAFYLPLEGLDLSHGYNAKNNLKLADYPSGSWEVAGIYAANPTLQRMISVEGLPLHLHGSSPELRQGGHVVKMDVASAKVTVWPLQDLVMQIKNIDQTWLPVRNLAAS
ncbi:MAG: acetolactate decarboxylase [Candidatus Methylacidiphilales bacterium]|nr:acetolactate decarboxylase [Candidatus Methylacidiphilales bacterium]